MYGNYFLIKFLDVLFQKLFDHCFKYFDNFKIGEFVAALFLKELIRTRNPIYQAIEETVNKIFYYIKFSYLFLTHNSKK